MLKLWARFDPVTAAQILANLEPLRRQLWLDDKHVRTNRRSPVQRDADTLAYVIGGVIGSKADAEAVERLRKRGTGRVLGESGRRPKTDSTEMLPLGDEFGSGGDPAGEVPGLAGDRFGVPPARVSVLIHLEALRGQTDELGITETGLELPPDQVRRLACDAEIIPIALDGEGSPADIGRTRRTPPERLRRRVITRDRHCRWPGCIEPPTRCDVHHIRHWANGGPTSYDNLVLLCHRHHQDLHAHDLRMVRQPDGTWATEPEKRSEREKGASTTTEQHHHRPRGP